jgi:CheY-like chemotaxis protein
VGTHRHARIRPEHHRAYPSLYHGQWFPVVERHDPDIPITPGHIWVDLAGKVQQVEAAHFEIVERTKPRVLVVDDVAAIRQTLHIALNKAGFEVLQAGDGEEASRLWRDKGPDLVITDIHMPRKSGLLLIQELQAQSPSTPVIAMTDGGPTLNLSLLGLAEMLGSVRTVAKPFTLDEMVKLAQDSLSRNR